MYGRLKFTKKGSISVFKFIKNNFYYILILFLLYKIFIHKTKQILPIRKRMDRIDEDHIFRS